MGDPHAMVRLDDQRASSKDSHFSLGIFVIETLSQDSNDRFDLDIRISLLVLEMKGVLI